ncbi:MAG: hypothetical protein AAF614_01245 [Chloroflexota bacterium]
MKTIKEALRIWLILLGLFFPVWALTNLGNNTTSFGAFIVIGTLIFMGLSSFAAPLLLLEPNDSYSAKTVPKAVSRRVLFNVLLGGVLGLVLWLGLEAYAYENLLRVARHQPLLSFLGGGFIGVGIGSLFTGVVYTSTGGRFSRSHQYTWTEPNKLWLIAGIRIVTGCFLVLASIWHLLV